MLQSKLIVATLLGALLLLSCPTLSANSAPRVVVSIAPLKMLVDPLLSEGSAKVLIPPGQSPHHFALKPSTMRALQDADLFIWVGPELESFLSPVVASLPSKVSNLALLPLQHHLLTARKQAGHHYHRSEIDPHIWLDPNIAIAITRQIAAQLILLNPTAAADINTRQQKLATEIAAADNYNQKILAPYRKQNYFVFHDAYQYLEKHYHLQPAQVINFQPDVPLSLRRLHKLQQYAAAENTHCVFADPQVAKKATTIFASSKQIHITILDPLAGTRSQTGLSYPVFIKNMAADMATCLSEKK